MKANKRWFVLLPVVLALLLSQNTKAPAQSGDEAAINRVLDQLEECYVKEDLTLLSSLISDSGFILLTQKPDDASKALILGKEKVLEVTKKRWETEDFIQHKHVNRQITMNGPVAKSMSIIRDQTKSGKTAEMPVFHVLAKENGQWRLVFSSSLLGGK